MGVGVVGMGGGNSQILILTMRDCPNVGEFAEDIQTRKAALLYL